MSDEKKLVVFFSRTGTTKKVAEYIKEKLSSDIEEIIDKKQRGGLIGWFTAGRAANNISLTEIENPSKDPSEYDLIVIGTPVWNDTVSTPIRTYIAKYKDRFNEIAYFTTQNSDKSNAIIDMVALIDQNPVASIQLRRKQDVETGNYVNILEGYVERIESRPILGSPEAGLQLKVI